MPSIPDSASAVTPDPVLAVLKGARELLTPEGAWMQRKYVSANEKRHCLLGACMYAPVQPLDGYIGAKNLLASLTYPQRPAVWNDKRGRTQAEVLDLLNRAIASRQEVQP